MKYLVFAFMFIFIVAADQDAESTLQDLLQEKPLSILSNEPPSGNGGDERIKEKCLKNGNKKSYEKVEEAVYEFPRCVKGLFDYEKMQEEIDKAKQTGDLGAVFRKYCRKSPELKGCVETLLNALEPCLDEQERAEKTILLNLSEVMIDSICFEEGYMIASFIEEDGLECLKRKKFLIKTCLEETLSRYSNQDPELLFDEKQCGDLTEIQTCVVNHLKKCEKPSPATFIGNMFETVKKNTPCKKFNRPNDATTLSTTILSLVAPLLAYSMF